MKKLKGKCKKCIGCNKIFEKGFSGVKKCKYYIRKIKEEESILSFIGFALFEIFIIIAFMFGLYKFLILNIGG